MENQERTFNQSAGKRTHSRGPVTPGLSPGYRHRFRLKHEKNGAEAVHQRSSAVQCEVCTAHLWLSSPLTSPWREGTNLVPRTLADPGCSLSGTDSVLIFPLFCLKICHSWNLSGPHVLATDFSSCLQLHGGVAMMS